MGWDEILGALRQPLQALLDPGERIFGPFLLGSVFVTWVVMGLGAGTSALRRGLWSRKTWAHASSRADVTMLFVRALVGVVLRIPWLAGTAAAAFGVGMFLAQWLGPADVPAWRPGTISWVYSVVLFVAWDLSRFLLHWCFHRFPVLWGFHQVHHSAEVLTPLTLYRVHPVETVLYDLRGLITTALVTGIFLWAFRGSASEVQLLGVNVFGVAFNAAGANLRHSHVWLRFGRLERWFLSPAQHQLHHARAIECQQSNYGTWLAVWDRMFGSWRPAPDLAPQNYGLSGANHRFDSVWSMLVGPVMGAVGRVPAWGRTWLWPVVTVLGLAAVPRWAAARDIAPSREPSVPVVRDPRAPVPVPAPTWPPARSAQPQPDPSGQADQVPAADESSEEVVDFELELPDETEAGPPVSGTADVVSDPAVPGRDGAIEAEQDAGDFDFVLDPISIVGTPEARAAIGGSVHHISEEELEHKEQDDVHRVLRDVPGVYMREEEGFGLRPNIGLRGASSDRSSKVTLMEDGILMAPAPYSAPAAYYFPLVTRVVGVEVFKGPAAIRHGPNTIGGAINLQTRQVPTESQGGLDAAVGMRGYGKLHGFWGASHKGFGVLLEGARLQSNGFKDLDGGGETGFGRNDAMVKARYASDPNRRWYHQVDVKGGFATERSYETYLGLTDEDFGTTPYRRYAGSQKGLMKWWRSAAEAGYFLARGTIFDLQVRAYRHDFHRAWRKFNGFRGADIGDVLGAPGMGQTAVYYRVLSGQEDSVGPEQALMVGTNDRRFEVTGGTVVTHWRPTWRWLEQDIELGVRVHHDQIRRDHTEDAHLMVNGTLVPEGTETSTTTLNRASAVAGAFHLLDTIRIKWFSVVPGARVEIIETSFEDRLADESSSNLSAVFIPGVGLHAQATPWLGFLAGVHSGFSPVAPGQPDEVAPERSINYEAGARVDHPTRRVRTRAEAIGFFNDYSNMTSVCTFSSGCDEQQIDRQFNAGRVFVYGAELLLSEQVRLPRRHWIEANLTYTFTGSNFRTAFTSQNPQLADVTVGDSLPYVPEHLASFGLGGGGKIWGLFLSGSYVGEMRDEAGQGSIAPAERIPWYYVLDLSGQIAPTQRSLVYFTIQNLTDNTYMVSRRPFGARPGMPFQLMVGFKYQFS